MKTTVVEASALGDDWTPGAHMPRLVTEIRNVRAGDRIKVLDHRGTNPGEPKPQWHAVTVLDTDDMGSTMAVVVDKWPIAYVASVDTMVELLEVTRQVVFHCTGCRRNDPRAETTRTVALESFYDGDLMARGGLRVLKLGALDPAVQQGLCPEHVSTLLD